MIAVLDASAVIAALQAEDGGEVTEAVMADPEIDCLIHAANACEVFYDTLKIADEQTALQTINDFGAAGLTIRQDMDEAFWQDAARLKAGLRRIALADCFAMALARREGAELWTADRHELQLAQDRKACRIRFIR